jgi:outer membrane protein
MRRLISIVGLVACVIVARGQDAENAGRAQQRHLSLDEAIRFALEKNKSIKVESFSRGIARANLLAAEGQFDPALNFQRSYREDGSPAGLGSLLTDVTRTDAYSLSLDGSTPWGLSYSLGGNASNTRGTFNGFADTYSSFAGIRVTQPLLRGFGFGTNLYGVRIAKAERTMSDWAFRQAVISAVTQIVVAYSDLTYAQENLRIARRARDLVDQTVEGNERRFRAGTISESDVLQARATAASRGEQIISAERVVRDAENNLRYLMGEETFPLSGAALVLDAPVLPEVEVHPADDLKAAFNLRPDYQSARQRLVALRAGESFARNQLLPRLDVVGSYGYSGMDTDFAGSRRMVADEDHRSYSAGVVVSVPLTFAEGRGRARAARLGVRQGEADLELLEQNIALSITNAAGQIETTRQRVIAARRAYELANQALDGEQKKLQAGTTTTFVVLNLQSSLTSVESSLSRALADQRRAHAIYEREIGITLERHKIELKAEK